MIDLRPVGYVIGVLVAVMGLAMVPSMLLDLADGHSDWTGFLEAIVISLAAGGLIALASAAGRRPGLSLRESFLITSGVWAVLPLFGALPFMLATPGASFTDAYFEAMSGLTTTGSTVFVGLDDMPRGTLLWRGTLQWLGGLGIVIVAMVFLPVMRVGGMQFFHAEGFDTLGKILPRALDISRWLIGFYLLITMLCAVAYVIVGMSGFEALVHAFTTVSTGGFSTNDASFAPYQGAGEYVGALFMLAASLPFARFVQLMRGDPVPLWRDVQVRAYLRWTAYVVLAIAGWRVAVNGAALEPALRESLFNTVSLFSGTGYGSEDVLAWGGFPLALLFIAGLIGGCTSSTACSIKIFRWLVVIEAIRARVRRLHSPHRVAPMQLGGRRLDAGVVTSVMVFFSVFMACFFALIAALDLTGLPTMTAITAAWTAIANIGPAYGPLVGPTGAMDAFPASAKWLMVAGMWIGRLEVVSVLVLLLPRFWRG
ncbi:MAG: TrkH family potassium uptake protein [Alphaproteobacteria bacterium]|nr:MAG: TrkH family potassium uptake protein [Alphaproteobacteria bacterium]